IGFSHTGAVATWTVEPVAVDKLLLNLNDQSITNTTGVLLDGEFTTGSGVMQSGDGTPGGAFRFRINVLAGDADRSGQVDSGDVVPIGAAFGSQPISTNWNSFADLDGSGQVDSGDIVPFGANFGSTLPMAEPPEASFPPSLLTPQDSPEGLASNVTETSRSEQDDDSIPVI